VPGHHHDVAGFLSRSLSTLRRPLTKKGNRPQEIADIYFHLGLIAASMNREDEAAGHFEHLLCLQPEAKLAKGLSPKVAKPFRRAQEKAKGITPFRLVHLPPSELPAAGGMELEVELVPDSLGMATGLTLRYRAGGRPSFGELRKEESGPMLLSVSPGEIPPGADGEYFIQINDRYGGVLWEYGSAQSPIRTRASTAPVTALTAANGAGAAASATDGAETGGGSGAVFFTQPWFLITAGLTAAALVAGGATAAIVVATAPSAEGAAFGEVGQEIGRAR